MPLVDVRDVTIRLGGVVALDRLSFSVDEGQICGLIGPNGAGNTTVSTTSAAYYKPTAGHVPYDGIDLVALAPHGIAKLGIAQTFQTLALFPSISLLENVMVGAHSRGEVGFLKAAARIGAAAREPTQTR